MIHSRYKVCKFEDKTDHAELVNEHMQHVIIELVKQNYSESEIFQETHSVVAMLCKVITSYN